MVVIFLAQGFEETEAVATIDILRRAGASVQTVGIGGKEITGSHGITVTADVSEDEFVFSKRMEMVILPGGMPGTKNLDASKTVYETLQMANKKGIFIAAICAAPMVLYHAGVLEGQKATIFPNFIEELPSEIYLDKAVCDSGRVITARSAGVAMQFGLLLAEKLAGTDKAKLVETSLHIEK